MLQLQPVLFIFLEILLTILSDLQWYNMCFQSELTSSWIVRGAGLVFLLQRWVKMAMTEELKLLLQDLQTLALMWT